MNWHILSAFGARQGKATEHVYARDHNNGMKKCCHTGGGGWTKRKTMYGRSQYGPRLCVIYRVLQLIKI